MRWADYKSFSACLWAARPAGPSAWKVRIASRSVRSTPNNPQRFLRDGEPTRSSYGGCWARNRRQDAASVAEESSSQSAPTSPYPAACEHSQRRFSSGDDHVTRSNRSQSCATLFRLSWRIPLGRRFSVRDCAKQYVRSCLIGPLLITRRDGGAAPTEYVHSIHTTQEL